MAIEAHCHVGCLRAHPAHHPVHVTDVVQQLARHHPLRTVDQIEVLAGPQPGGLLEEWLHHAPHSPGRNRGLDDDQHAWGRGFVGQHVGFEGITHLGARDEVGGQGRSLKGNADCQARGSKEWLLKTDIGAEVSDGLCRSSQGGVPVEKPVPAFRLSQ
jgi:hypothetical protein